MRRARHSFAVLLSVLALAGCGGSAKLGVSSSSYDLQAGYVNLINGGMTTDVDLSGTVVVNGTSTPFSGTGTFTMAAGVSTTFDNTAALVQNETISGTITVDSAQSAYSTEQNIYYESGSYAFLGQDSTGEYDVALNPFTLPTSLVGGSSGVLGTSNRYTDNTMSVALGTIQTSYATTAPVDSGGPISVAITNKIYDTSDTLVETDITTYTLTNDAVLSFVSASSQTSTATLSVTPQ